MTRCFRVYFDQPPPEKSVPEVVVSENGDGDAKEKEKNEEDMVTAEAKKIVETLTGTDSQTCKCVGSWGLLWLLLWR